MEYNPSAAMTIRLDDELPAYPAFVPGCRRVPPGAPGLSAGR